MGWYPADHTYDGVQLVSPHYRTAPDHFRLFDIPVRTSGWSRWQRKLWTKARNAALFRWTYPFQVIDRGLVVGDYLPHGITLDIFEPDPQYGPNSYGGFGLAPIRTPEKAEYSERAWEAEKGFALIHPKVVEDAFAGRVMGRLAGTMCHEIGHALGFGHGGTGVMRSVLEAPYYPSQEEHDAMVAYWGLP